MQLDGCFYSHRLRGVSKQPANNNLQDTAWIQPCTRHGKVGQGTWISCLGLCVRGPIAPSGKSPANLIGDPLLAAAIDTSRAYTYLCSREAKCTTILPV